MPWTDDRVDALKKLWHDGISASVIAQKIGDVTRNAVIGKVHRLGLTGRASPSRRRNPPRSDSLFPARSSAPQIPSKPRHRNNWQPRVRTTPRRLAVLPELGTPPEVPIKVHSLTEHTCRWPLGDPKTPDFHFCGRFKPSPCPYCDHHAALAFR